MHTEVLTMFEVVGGYIRPEWIDKTVRMPTAEDADPWGCVLIYDRYNGCQITGWRNTQALSRQYVTHWARMPLGPRRENSEDK